jgi:hypothetical protein
MNAAGIIILCTLVWAFVIVLVCLFLGEATRDDDRLDLYA